MDEQHCAKLQTEALLVIDAADAHTQHLAIDASTQPTINDGQRQHAKTLLAQLRSLRVRLEVDCNGSDFSSSSNPSIPSGAVDAMMKVDWSMKRLQDELHNFEQKWDNNNSSHIM